MRSTRLTSRVAGMVLATTMTALGQPVITESPQNQTNLLGTMATFTVQATGAEPLVYQWQHAYDMFNYVDRLEGTNRTLVISSAGDLDKGNYRVIVSDVQGAVTSSVARLYLVSPDDPRFTLQPATQSAFLGSTVRFAARLTTSWAPIRWQWQFRRSLTEDRVNLAGRGGSSPVLELTLTNLTPEQTGYYSIVATNSLGMVTHSEEAELSIDPRFVYVGKEALGDDSFLQGGPDAAAANWLDYDGDGWLDVLYARGWYDYSRRNELFRNNRDGTFTRVTNTLTSIAGRWSNIPAYAAGDFDGDGDLDLAIIQMPGSAARLFLSQLSQGSADYGLLALPSGSVGWWSTAADYDNDGWIDLYLIRHADMFPGPNCLLHNEGGVFRLLSNSETLFATATETIGYPTWVDYDEDGDLDFLGGTFGTRLQNVLWQNQGGGSFQRVANHVLVNTRAGRQGPFWGDYDNDGHLDVLMLYGTHLPTVLYRSLGRGDYEADPAMPALDKARDPQMASWVDFDNDGDLDLLVCFEGDSNARRAPQFFLNDGTGKLTEGKCPVSDCYFPLWGDYNNDGFLDLLAWRTREGTSLLLNNQPKIGNSNHWLKVELKGTVSNPNGIGAMVRVKATIGGRTVWQMRTVGPPTLASELVVHFGLGGAARVETVRVEWPSGLVQELVDVDGDQLSTVTETQNALISTPPEMTSYGLAEDGSFHASVSGASTNLRYVMQGSTDLVHWSRVMMRTNHQGTMEFRDAAATTFGHRYYRVVVP